MQSAVYHTSFFLSWSINKSKSKSRRLSCRFNGEYEFFCTPCYTSISKSLWVRKKIVKNWKDLLSKIVLKIPSFVSTQRIFGFKRVHTKYSYRRAKLCSKDIFEQHGIVARDGAAVRYVTHQSNEKRIIFAENASFQK